MSASASFHYVCKHFCSLLAWCLHCTAFYCTVHVQCIYKVHGICSGSVSVCLSVTLQYFIEMAEPVTKQSLPYCSRRMPFLMPKVMVNSVWGMPIRNLIYSLILPVIPQWKTCHGHCSHQRFVYGAAIINTLNELKMFIQHALYHTTGLQYCNMQHNRRASGGHCPLFT